MNAKSQHTLDNVVINDRDKESGIQMLQLVDEKGKEKEAEEGEDAEGRYWSSKREYILSTIGFCVGVGNLFRFPYLCNKNGGGAFLIPFVLSLMLIGWPLFAMEVMLGQFSGLNAQRIWSICPVFKGVGVAMVVVSTLCFWYYNTILAWALYYLASSFWPTVPWARCDGWWNTQHCFTYTELTAKSPNGASNSSVVFSGHVLSVGSNATNNGTAPYNFTGPDSNSTGHAVVSAAEEFWQHNVLQISKGFEEPGHVVWYLAVSMCAALFICFLALIKGVHSSGKVAYVTATAPYILLTILLIRGATLPGALDGIIFYLKPDFAQLLVPQVWVEAALQVFYSLGPSWGGLIVMSSYNKFHNNCLRDSLILTCVSEGTSIFGGFAIFSILGYMANVSQLPIDKVVSSGPGLAFIVYPEAISLLPLPQLWAVLFFMMIVTLALDSQMTMAEVGLTALIDSFPHTLRNRRPLVTAVFCAVLLVASIPFVTQGGIYVFQLVDWFLVILTIISISITECLVVGWIYGVARFGEDVHLMLGRRHPVVLTVFWKFITPVLVVILLVFTLMNYTAPKYGDYQYGTGGNLFGWAIALVSFVPIPVIAVYQLLTAPGSFKQRLCKRLKPETTVWKPADFNAQRMYH